MNDLWTTPETFGRLDLKGFEVEATDGSVGKVRESTDEAGGSYLIVDTGIPIVGKKVLLPAGLVERVDRDQEKLFVSLTKDEIKDAPGADADDGDYRSVLGDYYLGRRNTAAEADVESQPAEHN